MKAGAGRNTARLSRDHTIVISDSGLVTITGGKWTTYRKMAEDVVNAAVSVGGMELRPSRTHDLRLDEAENGTGASKPGLTDEVVLSAVRQEMARSVEDVLARRTRRLFLDARGAIAMAPRVAALMARELQRDAAWQAAQVESFTLLAQGYVWNSSSTPHGTAVD